jgi:RNA polymerase-associated protein
VIAAEPLFRARSWFLSDQFSVLDVAVAPMLWRLRRWEIDVADVAQSVQRYSQRLFARPGFHAGLSLVERDMRG